MNRGVHHSTQLYWCRVAIETIATINTHVYNNIYIYTVIRPLAKGNRIPSLAHPFKSAT